MDQAQPQSPKNSRYLVFFHSGCPDGVCAAAVADYYVTSILSHISTPILTLIPTDPANVIDAIVKAHEKFPEAYSVLMFDVAMRQPDFDKLMELFPHALAYDHHQTSMAVKPHPQFILDQSVSGAELAWRHFFPTKYQPAIVSYIGDRDTWKWALPNSREIAKYMTVHLNTTLQTDRGYPSVSDVWYQYLSSEHWLHQAVLEGKAFTQYENNLLKRMAARHIACWIDGNLVGVLEATELQSEVGELLYNAEGTLKTEFRGIPTGTKFRYSYVIVWSYDADKNHVRLSLRSAHTPFKVLDNTGLTAWEGPADVEKIASAKYKGGGHKAAAGGKCTFHELIENILSKRVAKDFHIEYV